MRQTYTVVKYDLISGSILEEICKAPLSEAVAICDENNEFRHLLRLNAWYRTQYRLMTEVSHIEMRLICSRGFAIKELVFD
jgi:hypothetical protein